MSAKVKANEEIGTDEKVETATVAETETETVAEVADETFEEVKAERDGPVESERAQAKKSPRHKKAAEPKAERELVSREDADVAVREGNDRKIISQSGHKRVVTELDRYNTAHLALVNSSKAGLILTGVVEGVETYKSGLIVAVLHNGPFKVVIPSEEFTDNYPEFRAEMGYKSQREMVKIMLGKRIGSEIDYMVRGEVDTEEDVAIASRLEGMKRIRNAKYLRKDPQGKRYMYEGAIAEARVQVVARSGVIIEIQGVETFVAIEELSYTRCRDAGELFAVGDIKPAKILEINISDDGEVTIKASLKAAEENPIMRVLPQLQKGGMYGGTVTVITTYGVFVLLDNKCECLCKYPSFGNEPVAGSKVIIKLTSVDEKKMRIMGTISQVRL